MTICRCGNEGWWVNDGHGIPLTIVCDDCQDKALDQFRPDIMEAYECDEPIEPLD
jgi:hypothetical protein